MRDYVAQWSSPAWRAEMEAWIEEALAARGEHVVAVREGRVRGWGVTLVAETLEGTYWAKEGHPATPREPAVLEWLAAAAPERLVPIVRLDASTRRVLSADAGPTLSVRRRNAGVPDDDQTEAIRLAGAIGALQSDVAATVGAATAMGVPRIDLRDPEREVESRLERAGALDADHPFFLSADERREIRARYPLLRDLAARLGDVPDSLEHNDLHLGNAFDVGGTVRIGDFGDSVISHPFASMRVLLASAARRGLPPEPLVEAYLDAWNGADAGGDADARAALDAATRLAAIQRFDLWIHIGAVTPRDQVEEWVPYARPLLRQIGAPLAELTEF